MMAELQALWAVAYLDGKIDLRERGQNGVETLEAMEKEVAEVGVWGRKRYLNLGEKSANVTFEFMPYFDTLLKDLGLETQRKGSWLEEWWGTYTPRDYRGIVQELVAKHYKDAKD